MKVLLFLGLILFCKSLIAQKHIGLDTLTFRSKDMVKVEKIAGDSLTTSFLIVITDRVKKH